MCVVNWMRNKYKPGHYYSSGDAFYNDPNLHVLTADFCPFKEVLPNGLPTKTTLFPYMYM